MTGAAGGAIEARPSSTAGQTLVAHELTHVLQQGPAAVQRSVMIQRKNSPGLTSAIDSAARKPRKDDGTIAQRLVQKGRERLEALKQVKPQETKEAASSSSTSRIEGKAIERINEHKLGKVKSTIEQGNAEGSYKVTSEVVNKKIDASIASFANTFFVKDGAITGMMAGDNFISKEATERVGGEPVFMNEIVHLQHSIVQSQIGQKKGIFAKKVDTTLKALGTHGGVSLPFSITRTPAPGTELAAALTWAKDNSVEERQMIALGSEHGSLVFQLCKDLGLGSGSLAINFDGSNPEYTLSEK